jgi:hypothetical protein
MSRILEGRGVPGVVEAASFRVTYPGRVDVDVALGPG